MRNRQNLFQSGFKSGIAAPHILGGRSGAAYRHRQEFVPMRTKSQLDILQKLHDVEDVLGKCRQQSEYWNAFENICILDAYTNGQLSLIFHLDIVCKMNDASASPFGKPALSVPNLALCVSNINTVNEGCRDQFEQQEMFVRDVEIVKRLDNTKVPSVVRPYFGNNKLEECGTQGMYFNTLKATFDTLLSFPNWEPSMFGLGKVNAASLTDGAPSKIESRMEIVNGISRDEGKLQEFFVKVWDFVLQLLNASIRVQLECGSILLFQKDICVLHVRDMFIGPIKLQSGMSKQCSHKNLRF
jgi:hypothetical protein